MLTVEFTGTTRTHTLQEVMRGTVHDLPGEAALPAFIRVWNQGPRTVSGSYDLRLTVGRATDEVHPAPQSNRPNNARSGLAISQVGKWVGGEVGWGPADVANTLAYIYPTSRYALSEPFTNPTLHLPPRQSLLLPIGFRVVWKENAPWARSALRFPVRVELVYNGDPTAHASTVATIDAPRRRF